MKYYIDTEFNGFGGELLSLALVREDLESIYITFDRKGMKIDPWVGKNVIPLMKKIPSPMPGMAYFDVSPLEGTRLIERYFSKEYLNPDLDDKKTIIADWPDDIAYLCKALITEPGYMIKVPQMTFELIRVDAYPTKLPGAIQHNAYWDAKALWRYLKDE